MTTYFKKTFFIHKNPTDPLKIIEKAVTDYTCDAIAYEVMDGEKSMNLKEGKDVWMPAILKHSERKLGVFALHKIHGSDPSKEAKKMLARIEDYVGKKAFAGIIIQLKPTYKQNVASPMLYINTIRAIFPNIAIHLAFFDQMPPSESLSYLIKECNIIYPIIVAKGLSSLYEGFLSVWNRIPKIPAKAVFPVISISDIPFYNYKTSGSAISSFWTSLMSDKTVVGAGIWNWLPEDSVPNITQDGSPAYKEPIKLRQLLRNLIWNKIVVDPEPPIPVITLQSLYEDIVAIKKKLGMS